MYRTLCDGCLSVAIERYGGINDISWIDTEICQGIAMPDQVPMPVMSRSGSSNRPLFSPSIRFMGRCSNGKCIYFYPGAPECTPWSVSGIGDCGQEFKLALDKDVIWVQCTSLQAENLEIYLGKENFFNDEFQSLKNQRLCYVEPAHLDHIHESYDLSQPLTNGTANVTWEEKPQIRENALVFKATINFPYGIRSFFMVLATNAPLTVDEPVAQYRLTCPFDTSHELRAAIAFGNDCTAALARAQNALDTIPSVLAQRTSQTETIELSAPHLSISTIPLAGEFLRALCGWQNALLVPGAGIRASSHNYGFFPLWDAIWPIRDFLWNGQLDQAEEMLRYLIAYPHMEAMPWAAMHLVLQVDEYLAYRDNPDFIEWAMPFFKRFYDIAKRLSNPETGMLASLDNAANDHAEQAGIHGFYCAACVNSIWYDALRVLANLAFQQGDYSLSSEMLGMAKRIDETYQSTFYVPAVGYLRLAVLEDGSLPPITVFQNSTTMGLDYLHGRHLMRRILPQLAAYQATALNHPKGHCAVPPDSPIPFEMWRNVHMNQHLGHECRLARLGGYPEEVIRLLNAYLEDFRDYGMAVETFNLTGCMGNELQNANWQAFSASGAAEGLRIAAGFAFHRGGAYYMPADDNSDVTIKNLHLKNRRFDMTATGSGHYAVMYLDGQLLPGTLQIPADVPAFTNWEIKRCHELPNHPLLLCAMDLPIEAFKLTSNTLTFTAGASGYFPICLASSKPCRMTVNNSDVQTDYVPEQKMVWADVKLNLGDQILIAEI